jgi:LPS sulfotransferase NodH
MTTPRLAVAHALRLRAAHRLHAVAAPHAPTSVRQTYLICTNPRSGSWLLSEGLASTSVAGNPREWFHAAQEQEERARWRMAHSTDLTFAGYLEHVRRRATSPNGICGVKLHYYQFAELQERLAAQPRLRDLTGLPLLSAIFPNVRHLWLRRRDKARQAISYYIASSTDRWWQIDGVKPKKTPGPATEPAFDPRKIRSLESQVRRSEARWKAYFKANEIDPFVVFYEDLLADYAGQIVRVLNWLGVSDVEPARVPPPRLQRQSTSQNEDWLKRYLKFKKAHPIEPGAAGAAAIRPARNRRRDAFRDPWRHWIAQQRLARLPEDEAIDVLVKNGCDKTVAASEVSKAYADPYLDGAAQILARQRKASALLTALGELRKLDSRPAVARRANVSVREFRDEYYAANRPVVLEGLISRWRALSSWTPDYLKRAVGDLTVEVMTDRNSDPEFERNAARHRTPMKFGEYIDKVSSGVATNDYNLVANNGFFQRFATHRLLEDLAPRLPYLKPAPAGDQCFLWLGPAGTFTQLHHDTSNILFAQIVGRKRYLFVPSTQWSCVYNTQGVFSDVDPESPDLARHPRFRGATVIEVVLAPGDVLFVPVGWWHHVRSIDVSISVSFTNFAYPNHVQWEPKA